LKVLLVYPEFPDTFWSLKYAIRFISKKSAYPPLGLLTVAAMLPQNWHKKLIDMNVKRLKNSHIKWADIVFIGAMSLQYEPAKRVVQRCKKAGVRVVAGGPLFTALPDKFEDIDYLVLDEAEVTLPKFLDHFSRGNPERIYTSKERPGLERTPLPLWELIDKKQYSSMNIQYSRGCPFNCEFCEITVLYGHKPRLKSAKQVVAELESLYTAGWRGSVFFVDDNFIGNKEVLKNDVLPAMIKWSEEKSYPFTFHTEASINMADDERLIDMMVSAGFDTVFIGIETPNQESLTECGKHQNKNRDLLSCVDFIQRHGLQVQGGFILGFDSDPDTIFDTLIKFIQSSGIVVAMVGLLNAPRGTRLFQRLCNENRITSDITGNNTDFSMNFIPRMDFNKLTEGYRKVVNTIYSPKNYYKRVKDFLSKDAGIKHCGAIEANGVTAFIKSIFKLGILGKERRYYWKLVLSTLFNKPSLVPAAVTFAICGYHFRKIYGLRL